ncbi:MAG: exodeoxyribonuclease VII large subunit [Bacteroidaceae bacterium]|jgi:exodeoxyribonuclease VII large subunit|nr:exodeoxyribonuclease VII large subunit [Bacteroidaceae bacterium]
MTPITLWELNNKIRSVIESNLDDTYWITGELSEARQASNGHFYGELIQKDENGRNVIARARVNCWAQQYNLIRLRFLHETGQEIRAGLKVLLEVQVTFHEQYGYALKVTDIDSTYTLGDLARRRKEILNKLEEEGILHDNQTLTMHRLTWRIAIVSAETAAGYGDFCDQLLHNEYGLRFQIKLFPATMQGQHVEESVSAALFQIASEENNWDAVVIIRGGGAVADMSDFDSYQLASIIAQFPLPVIVGIGHERDETVLDYVAHQRVKTPTAAAAFLIDHQLGELALLNHFQQRISQAANNLLKNEENRLERQKGHISLLFQTISQQIRHQLDLFLQKLRQNVERKLQNESHQLDLLEKQIENLNPNRILKLGFTITLHKGKPVKNPNQLHPGDHITTLTEHGKIESIVEA